MFVWHKFIHFYQSRMNKHKRKTVRYKLVFRSSIIAWAMMRFYLFEKFPLFSYRLTKFGKHLNSPKITPFHSCWRNATGTIDLISIEFCSKCDGKSTTKTAAAATAAAMKQRSQWLCLCLPIKEFLNLTRIYVCIYAVDSLNIESVYRFTTCVCVCVENFHPINNAIVNRWLVWTGTSPNIFMSTVCVLPNVSFLSFSLSSLQ